VLYETLGRTQLQNERDIAQRRMQAQRSGMTSSQLAAFEMQNIMAGQLGAQQVAQQSMLEMAGVEAQYAGLEAQNQANLFEILNSNRASVAAIDAQKYSSSAISQAAELYPDASKAEHLIIAKSILGMELSKEETTIYKTLTSARSVDSDVNVVGKTITQGGQTWKISAQHEKSVSSGFWPKSVQDAPEGTIINVSGSKVTRYGDKIYKLS
jgi:hypothetical protein